jgi:hypothetical protein
VDTQALSSIRKQILSRNEAASADAILTVRKRYIALSAPATLASRVAQLKQICTHLRSIVTSSGIKDVAVRRRLENLHNKTSSLADGLLEASYTIKDMTACQRVAATRLAEIAVLVRNPPKKIEKAKTYDGDAELSAPSPSARGDSTENLKKLLDGTPDVLKKYSTTSRDLNVLLAKNYIFTRVPVVPLSKPPLSPAELDKLGFKVSRIGYYPVIENQLVLGLNPKYVLNAKSDMKKTPVQLAQYLVDVLNKKSGHKYQILGGVAKHKTGYYFWLVTDRDTDLFRKAAGGNRFLLQSWGFAFESGK